MSARSHGSRKSSELHQLNHADNFAHSLTEPIFWIAAALCVVAEVAILRSAFIPRSHASDTGPIPNSPRGAEMMWAVIPAIGLAFLLAATWRAIH
ncbi:MAG: hypothetical protein ABI556_11845 [Gemmatimonadales bacterium]